MIWFEMGSLVALVRSELCGGCFLKCEIGVQACMRRFDRLVNESERDHGAIDARLRQPHCSCVSTRAETPTWTSIMDISSGDTHIQQPSSCSPLSRAENRTNYAEPIIGWSRRILGKNEPVRHSSALGLCPGQLAGSSSQENRRALALELESGSTASHSADASRRSGLSVQAPSFRNTCGASRVLTLQTTAHTVITSP